MDKINDCKTNGHEWSPFSDFCLKCMMTFDDYRLGRDNKAPGPCDCGATKAGFDSHTHWCTQGSKK